MLYVFTGSDAIAVRGKAHEFLDARLDEGARAEHITAEDCTADLLRDRAGAQSLFSPEAREAVLIDSPGERPEAREAVLSLAAELAESPNTFVLIESALPAALSRDLKKYAAEYHGIKSAEAAESFNVFALADALARRDKKSLWVLLLRAYGAGLSAEEIIGTLSWQIKTMRLAARTKSASESGLKPFVYTKAKRGLEKFKPAELDLLSRSILEIYHDAHLGKLDADLALERWVLGV